MGEFLGVCPACGSKRHAEFACLDREHGRSDSENGQQSVDDLIAGPDDCLGERLLFAEALGDLSFGEN